MGKELLYDNNVDTISLKNLTRDEQSWWVLDNLSLEDQVRVKFNSWQKCHYDYFFHHLVNYNESVTQVIDLMTRTPQECFSYRPSDYLYGYKVEFIDSYFDLE